MKKYEIINTNAERVAENIFKKIGDESPSILSLIKFVEENYEIKIKVSLINLRNYGKSGLVYFNKPSVAQIVINQEEPECRQRLTLCHEIAHLIKNAEIKFGFCDSSIFSKWGLERFCDRFAATYLMPKKLFIEKWDGIHDDLWKKPRLANYFNVSGEAVYYRAKELKLIKE